MAIQDKEIMEDIKISDKKKKWKKRWYLAVVGLVILLCITICVITGCFSTVDINTSHHIKTEDKITTPAQRQLKPDTKKFVKTWNKKLADIQYGEYSFLNLNLEKYKLDNENPQKKIDSFLKSDKNKFIVLKSRLNKSLYKSNYMPLIVWIEEKQKWKKRYSQHEGPMDSYALMDYVENIVTPSKGFSNNTIDKVIQLNEFCYYFESNKQSFYRKSYTKNIKRCKQIQEVLDEDNIEFLLK